MRPVGMRRGKSRLRWKLITAPCGAAVRCAAAGAGCEGGGGRFVCKRATLAESGGASESQCTSAQPTCEASRPRPRTSRGRLIPEMTHRRSTPCTAVIGQERRALRAESVTTSTESSVTRRSGQLKCRRPTCSAYTRSEERRVGKECRCKWEEDI